jgi:predicted ATP-dependent endonuclease of OLD family
VTVENYRSISAARKIQISQLTTLVGPNNEGKSNILRAIVIAMNQLVARRNPSRYVHVPSNRIAMRRRRLLNRYEWAADCPLKMQTKGGESGSKITLEFELSDQDVIEFYDAIKSRLNGTLPVSMTFKQSGVEVTIAKQGRGGKTLSNKASKIADFISGKIDVQYIPAVRTAESAQEIVEDLVDRELEKAESDPKYQQAISDIAALQEPILEDLSRSITATMKEFLPNITQARVGIQARDRSYAFRGLSSISLDDGVETPLEAKGDGVQSLAALALMRHASLSRHEGKEVLIALEEPESHLHPNAIRQLRVVLTELSARYQVVLTTHNAIFTNRQHVQQNII